MVLVTPAGHLHMIYVIPCCVRAEVGAKKITVPQIGMNRGATLSLVKLTSGASQPDGVLKVGFLERQFGVT